jgi:hypothetical protein
MFGVIQYTLIALFGYFFPKIGLVMMIIISIFCILMFYLYRVYNDEFSHTTIEQIEDVSVRTTPTSVIMNILCFGLPYYYGLCAGNFGHTHTNQFLMALELILLGIEFTIKPK